MVDERRDENGPPAGARRDGAAASAVLLMLRLGFAAIWFWAAWNKLRDPQSFAESIQAFKILPDHLVVLFTFAIPWTEVLAASLLVVGLWTRAAAAVLLMALLVFIGAIVSVLARKMSVHCGCFGKGYLLCPGELGWCHVGQNVLLSLAALVLVWRGGGRVAGDAMEACGRGQGQLRPER